MHPVGFEPTISAGEQPQTHALDCAAIETGNYVFLALQKVCVAFSFKFFFVNDSQHETVQVQTNMAVLLYPVLPDIRRDIAWLEGYHPSSVVESS